MKRSFKVGDRVRVIKPGSPNFGVECIVIEVRRNAMLREAPAAEPRDVPVAYVVDIAPRFALWVGYEACDLEPLYDGNEKVSWSECLWQPRSVKA